MEDIDKICNWIDNEYNFATNSLFYFYPINNLSSKSFIKLFDNTLRGKLKYISKTEKYFIYNYKKELFIIYLNFPDWNENIMIKIIGDV